MDKKIFIIEDDANILSSLEAKFGLAGLEVDSDIGLGSIEEILTRIIIEKPDYLVLDLILPNVDGFNLLKAIKANPDLANMLVFIFTNLSDQDSQARSAKLGAEFYFIKSQLNINDFVARIMKIIDNRNKLK